MGYKQESLQGELKMIHIDYVILNSHVTVFYLRFVKRNFFCGKTEEFKIAIFFPPIYPCV